MIATIQAVLRYLAFVLIDGDELNDWLTHMPAALAAIMLIVGRALATIIGA